MQALNKLEELNKITLIWVPDHQGSLEITDGLAKELKRTRSRESSASHLLQERKSSKADWSGDT